MEITDQCQITLDVSYKYSQRHEHLFKWNHYKIYVNSILIVII